MSDQVLDETLLAKLKEDPEFVQPESRRNEMIGFIEAEGLEDLSNQLVDIFNNSLRPKWHRERFTNLNPGTLRIRATAS
jgi:hypothetical protein